MKYLYFLLLITAITACNNKDPEQNKNSKKPVVPYYKINDLKQMAYYGHIQQINDTIYEYAEKQNGKWVTPDIENYELRIHKYDTIGNELIQEAYIISDAKMPSEHRYYHKATWVYARKEDTLVRYGLLHDFMNGKTDTIIITYQKPIGALAYVYTDYKLNKKTKQYTLNQTGTQYLDEDYQGTKLIIAYAGDTLRDTITFTKIADRTNETDTNNIKVILAKDSIGNPSKILDRSDPSRKQLHRIGYSYYK